MLPLPMVDDPTARPVGTLVVADGFVVHVDLEPHPSSELAQVADLLARGVRSAMADLARRPSAVLVRDATVATMVARLLEPEGISVRHERPLPALGALGRDLVSSLSGMGQRVPLVSMTHTWAAWRVPTELVARLFAAAAAFHRAQPWSRLDDDDLLELELGSGRVWYASVLGSAGVESGLTLFEDRTDVDQFFVGGDPEQTFSAMRSTVLSVTFDHRGEIPKPMVREIASAGWEVASLDAYPSLIALNTPGGVVTQAMFADLIDSFQTVVRFVAANESALVRGAGVPEPIEWADPEAGSYVTWLPPVDEVSAPWKPVGQLRPGLPEGEHADPEGALDREPDADRLESVIGPIIERFADSLRGAPEARARRDVENARFFADFLIADAGITPAAVTELDLRSFLYDWFPRKVRATRTFGMSMRASLRRFFEFLEEREGISYPWARDVLADKDVYEFRWDSFPGGFFWDAGVREWMAELNADLDARAMLPAEALAGVGEWGDMMGPKEARLYRELQRRWLIWRDEVIRAGATEPAAVRELLERRQHEWEAQPGAGGKKSSPSEVIARERKARPPVRPF